MKNKLSKKAIIIIAAAMVVVLGVTVTMCCLFIPVKIDVDIDSIEYVGSRIAVQEKNGDTPLSLYIPDGNGGISSDGFKILTFTDMHLDTHREKGAYTIKYFIANVQAEKPDLVVIDGDVVTSSTNRARAVQFCEVMEKLGVYWIAVLGNHEGDSALSMKRSEFIELYASYPHCLVESETKYTSDGTTVWGYGNTQVNLLTTGGVVSQSLFFLDAGNEVTKQDVKDYGISKDSYDYVKTSQITWYEECIEKLDYGVKSMMFLHIPLPEYEDAYDACPKTTDGSLAIGVVGTDGTVASFGEKREGVCCSEYNSGLFASIVKNCSTQAVIVGHDHVNDFRIKYKDVWLCYNRASGYSSYNNVTSGGDTLIQGASTYTVQSNGEIIFGDIMNGDRYDDSGAYELY